MKKRKVCKKTSPIKIDVTVDENKVPEKIIWSAPDGGIENEEAQKNASESNIAYISNRCIKQEYQRLFLKVFARNIF